MLIIGIGTDIIEIERVLKASGNKRFMEKCFTENELELIKSRNISTAAGNFAGKEAVSKAIGTGFLGIKLTDIEILRHKNGKPYVILHGNAANIAADLGILKIHISISHCVSYASAFAVIEGG